MAKVAIVYPLIIKGSGVGRVIYEISKRLCKEHKIDVYTFMCDLPISKDIGVFLYRKPIFQSYDSLLVSLTIKHLLNSTKLSKYDLIWIHSVPSTLSALRIRKMGIPILYTFHGIRTIRDFRMQIYRVIASITFPKMDCIVGVSRFVTEEARRYGGRALTIYNGCDLELFHPTWEDEGFILFSGVGGKHKGLEFAIIASRLARVPLKVTGGCPKDSKILAEKIGADVEFLGVISDDDLIKFYQRCSFLVSGSFHEAFGLNLLEAQACGKPVIARNCSAIPEVVRHGETGFLYNNMKELVSYIRLLWIDEDLRSRMGSSARKHAEKFSWDVTSSKYRKVINSLTTLR
ncbi:MAG: glycosyltransferase family 4 protein [Nitrososphaerota archaeon]|nr:glycosyltransferase family 4 protein [Candidatus Bathyarchaeota archaeon]MDW8048703.1 glycosyltransferase family 4 protein [Nitrososphaerota archaeon]